MRACLCRISPIRYSMLTSCVGSYPDKVRGLLNEGGLYGERQGWHLPGFDTSSWESRDLSEGSPSGGAGVGFFVTTFDLDLPEDMDIQLSFQFEPFNEQPYRALLFVNGWQYGKVSKRTCGVDHGRNSPRDVLVARGECRPADQVPRASGHPRLQRQEVSAIAFSPPVTRVIERR